MSWISIFTSGRHSQHFGDKDWVKVYNVDANDRKPTWMKYSWRWIGAKWISSDLCRV